jgi:hypothetical protein
MRRSESPSAPGAAVLVAIARAVALARSVEAHGR